MMIITMENTSEMATPISAPIHTHFRRCCMFIFRSICSRTAMMMDASSASRKRIRNAAVFYHARHVA